MLKTFDRAGFYWGCVATAACVAMYLSALLGWELGPDTVSREVVYAIVLPQGLFYLLGGQRSSEQIPVLTITRARILVARWACVVSLSLALMHLAIMGVIFKAYPDQASIATFGTLMMAAMLLFISVVTWISYGLCVRNVFRRMPART